MSETIKSRKVINERVSSQYCQVINQSVSPNTIKYCTKWTIKSQNMNKALKIPVKSLESAFCDFYGYLGQLDPWFHEKRCWSRSHWLWSQIPGLWSLIPPLFRPLIPDPIYLVTTLKNSRALSSWMKLTELNIRDNYLKRGILNRR